MQKFAERLNAAMNAASMSAADLSRRLGISDAVVSQYRNGKYKPKQNRLLQMSSILNVSPAWLLGLDSPISEDSLTLELNELIAQLDKVEKARVIGYIENIIARR